MTLRKTWAQEAHSFNLLKANENTYILLYK